MKISAVICEYNPFHNGHKYLTDCAKEKGATHITAIMGGNFLQRGNVAIADKHIRTACALSSGVDLVLELPVPYATASAEKFALGGVETANGLGCIDSLLFGSEAGDMEQLENCAELLISENFLNRLKHELSNGTSYPRAVYETAETLYGKKTADILSSPNNTLAIEYIKALKKTKSHIIPETVLRKGTGYHSSEIWKNISSASYIRKLLTENNEDAFGLMPENCCKILKSEFAKNGKAVLKNGERAMLYKLRSMTANDFKCLPDVSEGLENRIYNAVRSCTSIDEIASAIKTKRYTHARITRILLYAFLDITKEIQNSPLPYIRVLGFNSKGAEILKTAKKTAKLPIITKISDSLDKLSIKQKEILMLDIKASDLHSLFKEKISPCGSDYTSGLVLY